VAGGPVDLTPTKYVVFLWITGLLLTLLLLLPGRAGGEARRQSTANRPKRRPQRGRGDGALLPRPDRDAQHRATAARSSCRSSSTLFFFIAISNLLGLIPYGASATTSISVTATLAIMSLIAIEYAGIRALGWGYLNTIFYWNKDLPLPLRILML
jgi:F-type H+-transporting ATPase subunit a